jgi:hypothetical protein
LLRQLFGKGPEPEERPIGIGDLHDGNLLARWFAEYRLDQEIDRARRYGRPLAVLVASPALLPHETLSEDALSAAVAAAHAAARTTDLVGWFGEREIVMVLVETAPDDARTALSRWRDEMWLKGRAAGGPKWTITLLEDLSEFEDIPALQTALTVRRATEERWAA